MNRFGAAALLACLPSLVLAQDAEVARYHFDFTRMFATPEAEKAARSSLEKALQDFEALRGRIASDAGTVLRALRLYYDVHEQAGRHYNYLDLRYSVDTTNRAAREEASALDTDVAARASFFEDEL